jgi:LacI family transcriptional regulator, galactose operon repressor
MAGRSPSSIQSVAAAAGVSPTTVSHALSGKRAVSEETRKRIFEAIEVQNYRPNKVAKSLRSRRTQSIAMLLVDITNPYYPTVARAVHDGLEAEGYVSFIGNTDGDERTERNLLDEMMARGVDGIIMQPVALSAAEVREVVGPATPLVITTTEDGDVPADTVLTDDVLGLTEAVRHLRDKNVHDLAFVGGLESASAGPFRVDTFLAAAAAAGVAVRGEWIENAPFTRDGGTEAARRLLDRRDRPRAILCANDLVAIGVMEVVRGAGLRVPEDIAIVGFDDIDMASLVTPALTTVVNPASQVGDACAATILWRVEQGPDTPYRRTILPTRLVARHST